MSSRVGKGQCNKCHRNTGRAVKRNDLGDIIQCTACPPPCDHTGGWEGYRGVDRDMCRTCRTFKFEGKDCTSKIGHIWHKQKVNVWMCKFCPEEILMPICPKCKNPILRKYAEQGIKQCVPDCTVESTEPAKPKDDSKHLFGLDSVEDILTPEQKDTEVQAYKLTGLSGENVSLLYAGELHKGFDERCQNYADAAKCCVRYDRGIEVKYFNPIEGDTNGQTPA